MYIHRRIYQKKPWGYDNASIVLLALWCIIFLGVFAAGLYAPVHVRLEASGRIRMRVIAQESVLALIEKIRAQYRADARQWNVPAEYGQTQSLTLNESTCAYRVFHEEGKINLNTMPIEYLRRLPGCNQACAEAITAAPKPFAALEEVAASRYVSPEIFASWEQLVTVYGNSQVNVNAASPEVLALFGVGNTVIEAIAAFRRGPDGIECTRDDQGFATRADLEAYIRQSPAGTTGAEAVSALCSANAWGTISTTLAIAATVKVSNRYLAEYDIIFDGKNILQWREK